MSDRTLVGYVNVESGELALLDPGAASLLVRRGRGVVSALEDKAGGVGWRHYFPETRNHLPMAVLTFNRLGGDGCFPVYVEREESPRGHLIRRITIEVEAGSPDNEDEYQKRVKGEVP